MILWPIQLSTADRSVSARQQPLGDTITQERGPGWTLCPALSNSPTGMRSHLPSALLWIDIVLGHLAADEARESCPLLLSLLPLASVLSYLKVQVKLNCIFFVSYSMSYISVLSVVTFSLFLHPS